MKRLAIGLLLLSGCSNKPPGEVVGTYRVTMTLVENTCGPNAVFLSDGRTYSAQLRADDERGYWRLADGKPLPGKYDDEDREFSFTFSSVVATSEPDAGEPVCQLIQNEVLSGRVHGGKNDELPDAGDDADASTADAGVAADPPSTLTGTHELNIAPAQGSDCRQAFPPRGPFEKLPCKVRYSLKGIERKEF